ncbi:MAG: transcriptional regulator NrdR [Planctomycetota bacterium]
MRCPFCHSTNDKVIDSRSTDRGFVIRRRRRCLNCEKRFTTFERVGELDFRVVKKDGSREPFQSEKIRKGIERACWKRPIAIDRVEQILIEIVQGIYVNESPEIDSSFIGEMVMEKLIDLDDVAYIRFASVYRQFRDIHDFFEEVRPILDKNQINVKAENQRKTTKGESNGSDQV